MKDFRFSSIKIKYMKFRFSNIRYNETVIKISDDELYVTKSF